MSHCYTPLELIIKEFHEFVDEERATHAPKYFKAGKGEYGEGDFFLGISMPNTRFIVQKFKTLIAYNSILELTQSQWHEERMLGLLFLVERYKQRKKAGNPEALVADYVQIVRSDRANNWDLVDSTAYHILGDFLLNRPKDLLYMLADSGHLWSERLSLIATLAFIRKDHFQTTIDLCILLMDHKHDLIHKASGWMLREIGVRNPHMLIDFLDTYTLVMPRTALRYAIEKMDPVLRQHYLHMK